MQDDTEIPKFDEASCFCESDVQESLEAFSSTRGSKNGGRNDGTVNATAKHTTTKPTTHQALYGIPNSSSSQTATNIKEMNLVTKANCNRKIYSKEEGD